MLYLFIWFDVIYYKIKDSGCYVSKVVYIVFGINIKGCKELFGLYVLESEGVNYWLLVLIDLYNCGVFNILIVCVDGFKGFFEVIGIIYFEIEV